MLKRALWTVLLLVGPLWATVAPCCHLKSARSATAMRHSGSAKHACCSGASHAAAAAEHATACARASRASDGVTATSSVATQAVVATPAVAPAPLKPAPEPARREASPRIGPLFFSHQALLF
jgi:hypothetical protein